MLTKNVILTIEVPKGKYCSTHLSSTKNDCEYFYYFVGQPTCSLKFIPQKTKRTGWILKPKECKELIDYN